MGITNTGIVANWRPINSESCKQQRLKRKINGRGCKLAAPFVKCGGGGEGGEGAAAGRAGNPGDRCSAAAAGRAAGGHRECAG